MRSFLLLSCLAACADTTSSTELAVEEQALIGCWEGLQGDKTVQFRFHDDLTVDNRIAGGTWYHGTWSVDGDALTYDFGEEPPTYHIVVTPDRFSYVELPFTFTRYYCDR